MTHPTLFIDFDGTLCHGRFWQSLPEDAYKKVQTALFLERKEVVKNWMRGLHTAEAVTEVVAEATGLSYSLLWSILVRDSQSFTIAEELLELVDELRQHHHTVLMTDNMDTFTRFTVPALHLEQHFDVIVNSFDQKRCKKDENGQIFRDFCVGPLEQAVLIDDSENGCQLFTELGGTAYMVTNEEPTLGHLKNLLHSVV